MLSLNIPSLLSKRNIGAVSRFDIEHRIYATQADRERIESDPIYQYLTTQIACRIVTTSIEAITENVAPYDATIARMNAYHQLIIDDCAAVGATWLFDQPDHLWGDGSLLHLVELAADGWDVVFFPGVRTNFSGVAAAIGEWRNEQTGVIEIPRRRLVELALKHMHFHDLTRFWGPLISTAWPHHIAWRVAPGCFVRRCFYPQPFLVNARNAPRLVRSVDFSYIDSAMASGDRVHFITDSDDFFLIEVTDKFRFLDYSVGKLSAALIGNWAIRYASEAQCEAFCNSVVYHTDDVSPRRLKRITRFGNTISNAVDAMVALERAAASIVAERPRAAAFIRLCLGQEDLVRRVYPPHPFTLRIPSEWEIPDADIFSRPLSLNDIDLLTEWIRQHILPVGSATGTAFVANDALAESS